MLDQEIRRAARQFFDRTKAWAVWLDTIYLVANLRDYDLDIPAGTEVVRLQRATVNGAPINVAGWSTLAVDLSSNESQGGRQILASSDLLTVTLGNEGEAGAKLQVQVALMPSRTATSIPDDVLSKHVDAVIEGAKYNLMRVPGPLYKPKDAEAARRAFENHVSGATVEAYRDHTMTTPRASVKWC